MVKVRLAGKGQLNVISVNDLYFYQANSKRKNFENILLKITAYARKVMPPSYLFIHENCFSLLL